MAGWSFLNSLLLQPLFGGVFSEFFGYTFLYFYSINICLHGLSLLPRSIRCLRNIIHWNLISAFILRNATWFIVQLTMNPEVHESNVVSGGPISSH